MSETTAAEKATEKAAAAQVSRDLSVISHGNAAVPMPANFEQMTRFASLMSQGTNMVGAAFRDNPGACLGALIQAMRWGMDPYSCSQKMYIANKSGEGPIAYEAQLVHAVILKNAPLRKRPRCTYTGEGQSLRCHVVFDVIGEDEPLTYDSPALEKVKKNSPLWKDDPEQQLWYYSVRAGARRHFPDILMGVYTPDEVDQIAATQKADAEIITLSKQTDTDNIPEAEYSDGTAVLAKNAAKATKKKAAPKDGPKGDGLGETSAPGVAIRADGAPPESTAPAEGHDADAGGSSAAAAPNEPDADVDVDDDKLVAEIEAAINPATPMANRRRVKANFGLLSRIGSTSEDTALASRANRLIEAWSGR